MKTVICGIKPRRKQNPTRYQLELRLMQTQKLLDQGFNGKQIAEKLGVGKSTGERYVQTVTKRNKAKWDELRADSLQDRALLIKNHYEKIIEKAKKIVDDPNTKAKDLEIASKLLIGSHINIYNMLKDGPIKLPKLETKALEDKND